MGNKGLFVMIDDDTDDHAAKICSSIIAEDCISNMLVSSVTFEAGARTYR